MTGCYVNYKMESWWHPFFKGKLFVFMHAGGVGRHDDDHRYVQRLLELETQCCSPVLEQQNDAAARTQQQQQQRTHGKCLLLAFDQTYDEQGVVRPKRTGFHVPNAYVADIVRRHPTVFEMAMSVHPYRKDALQALETWAARGVRVVKWLPNSQHINVTHPLCVPFFRKMRALNLTLLSHAGEEHSVDAGGVDNALGNPLKLRVPLDLGVRVISAHCATEGSCVDIDVLYRGPLAERKTTAAAEGKQQQQQQQTTTTFLPAFRSARTLKKGVKLKKMSCFDAVERLMDTKRYDGLLFGDISSITAFKRAKYIPRILDRVDLHHRLCYGTDWPVPGIYFVIWTSRLASLGVSLLVVCVLPCMCVCVCVCVLMVCLLLLASLTFLMFVVVAHRDKKPHTHNNNNNTLLSN
jgi:hypothetical protein